MLGRVGEGWDGFGIKWDGAKHSSDIAILKQIIVIGITERNEFSDIAISITINNYPS